jgi:methionine-rich copper-binding protein CopC
LFKAAKAGSGKVLARYDNVAAGAAVKVKPAEIEFFKTIPEKISLEAGERIELQAVGEDRFGNVLDPDVRWSLSDDSLATITADGVLSARGAGTGQVVATSRVLVDLTPLEVRVGALSSIDVSPAEAVVASGASVSFQAQGQDGGGNSAQIVPEWSVDEGLGAIDKDGLFTGDKVGEGTVTVVSGGIRGAAKVKVVASKPASIELQPDEITITAGETTSPSFRIFDANGNEVPNPTYRWGVEGGVGFVDAEHRFHARKAGNGLLHMVSGEVRAEIPVTVELGEVHTIELRPAEVELAAGESVTLTANGFDSQGNDETLEPVWSAGGGVGKIDEQGFFQAVTVGKGYVAAQLGDVTGVAVVLVRPGPVARVVVEPVRAMVNAGKNVGFAAVAVDALGNIAPAEFTWSIAPDGQIGEVTEFGSFTGMVAGEGRVTATTSGVSGSAKVRVEPGTVRRIVVRPMRVGFRAGMSTEITAVGEDDHGNTVPLEPSFSVAPPGLGRVTRDGLFTAQATGSGSVSVQALGLERCRRWAWRLR